MERVRGKGLRRWGPDSSCSHPTPTRLRPSPPAPPAPVALLGIARVQAARHWESFLQQAGSSGHEPSPTRPPHLPRQIWPSHHQSVSCCGWFCSVVNSPPDGSRARRREQGRGWNRPWTHSSRESVSCRPWSMNSGQKRQTKHDVSEERIEATKSVRKYFQVETPESNLAAGVESYSTLTSSDAVT